MPPVAELSFRRCLITLQDAGRLGEGEDLNDALLDFFISLGQHFIPRDGDSVAPVAYLGSYFFKTLRGSFANSGEEGWKNVQNWAKRKAGGLFKDNYGAFSVPINEDLKDDKGQDAGNHWWLALVLNPGGGARQEPTAVMCLDSMQRRKKQFTPPLSAPMHGTDGRYYVEVTEVEQYGYLLIITFAACADGSFGPVPRPEGSKVKVGEYMSTNAELGLRVNMPGGHGSPGRFEGELRFSIEGQSRCSIFRFEFADAGFAPILIEFDPFTLTKLQKDVSRYLGGYMAKEWSINGPSKMQKFDKQSARAMVADVCQQENLNDCGVFVLENTLRSLTMPKKFLLSMATASADVLKSFPWPTQQDITQRKLKLKAITARLFRAAAETGSPDIEQILRRDVNLREEVVESLTDGAYGKFTDLAGSWQQEMAARQADKDVVEEEKRKKEGQAQARKEEERAKREQEARRAEEQRLRGKSPPKPKGLSESQRRKRRAREEKYDGAKMRDSREKDAPRKKRKRGDDEPISSKSSSKTPRKCGRKRNDERSLSRSCSRSHGHRRAKR